MGTMEELGDQGESRRCMTTNSGEQGEIRRNNAMTSGSSMNRTVEWRVLPNEPEG
jgi:hypothetical protein